MLGVSRADFDQVTVVAGNVMNLEDLRKLGERLRNAILGASLVAANGNVREEAEAKYLGIHYRGVTLQRASGLELPNALEHCGRRQADGAGYLNLCLAGVGLKEVEDLQVDFVGDSVVLHNTDDYDRLRRPKPTNVLLDWLFAE